MNCFCSLLILVGCQSNAEPDTPQPAPLKEAASRITVPEGFHVSLFAGEPDVVQPIAFTIDSKGRLWVVENFSYPNWTREGTGHDRVTILEDSDGDGTFDHREVFWDQGTNLSGIEIGFGGVWLCAAPNLIFIPDSDRDDKPDGPPQIILNGFTLDAKHNVFNGLTWGPDGWLYGNHGILASSLIGHPDTPAAHRVEMNCGVWRIHPVSRKFEVVANGTTNPWGLDFNQYGEMFITNCVIKHVFHVTPGAHFDRMYGTDFNPHLYQLMESCADHIHWGGGPWQNSRTGQIHDQPGGGHAHAGAMIYLGDNWPSQYRDKLFTCNIHGNRINCDSLIPFESGYKATHNADFMHTNDSWFRGLEMKYGPDGSVYVTDWSDTGECHDYDHIDKATGRIYRIVHGKTQHQSVDLYEKSPAELATLQSHPNAYFARHSRRILQEHSVDRPAGQGVISQMFRHEKDDLTRLRLLWTLHATGEWNDTTIDWGLSDTSEHIRAWTIRLLFDSSPISSKNLDRVKGMASNDSSARVRLSIASSIRRLDSDLCLPIAHRLMSRQKDQGDVNITLLTWYAIEPHVTSDTETILKIAGDSDVGVIREFVARRLTFAKLNEPEGLAALVSLIASTAKPDDQHDLLQGMNRGLDGAQNIQRPQDWSATYTQLQESKQFEVRHASSLLALKFGMTEAIDDLFAIVGNSGAPPLIRTESLNALTQSRVPRLLPLLLELLDDETIRTAAIQSLGSFDSPRIAPAIISRYDSYDTAQKQTAIDTLASRRTNAERLIRAIESTEIPRADVPVFTVRQLRDSLPPDLLGRLSKVWGTIRATPAAKQVAINRYRALLDKDGLPDLKHGRALFSKTCAACHRLFGQGNSIAPDLTGSNRRNFDYLLENLLDPNAVIGRDYQLTKIATTDGRILSGIVVEDNDRTITLQTQTNRLILPKNLIEQRETSDVSMMPEGLIHDMTPDDVRDLFGYLGSSGK